MSDVIKSAGEAIKLIRSRAAEQNQKNRELLTGLFRADGRRERRPPGDFGDSSFLFIRSHAADNGVRPLPGGTVFWLSPDIRIRPITGVGAYTQTLEAGRSYDIEVLLRNRGDLPVPSAKVELYLTDPTLGFDTRFATRLGVASTWVPGVGSGKVNLPFVVPGSAAGHKCMIARTFSFSPLDLPLDDTNLSPPLDRHVAQLNLNILPSASPFQFRIVHQPNFEGTLQFRAATLQELQATGHPLLAEMRLVENARLPAQLLRASRFEHLSGGAHEVSVENNGRTVRLRSSGEGPSLEEQKRLQGELGAALGAIASGEARPARYKDLFAAHRKLAHANVLDSFSLETPSLHLAEGEMTAVHLEAKSVLGNILGGLTLLFTA